MENKIILVGIIADVIAVTGHIGQQIASAIGDCNNCHFEFDGEHHHHGDWGNCNDCCEHPDGGNSDGSRMMVVV